MSEDRLTAIERIMLDPGFRQVSPPADGTPVIRGAQSKLSRLRKRQRVPVRVVRVSKAPLAPDGMTEAALLRKLQAHGIGRPATYAGIVESLLRHRYITRAEDGLLRVTARGVQVHAFLIETYPHLFDPSFTARMERELDALAQGERSYRAVLASFWREIQNARGSDENA